MKLNIILLLILSLIFTSCNSTYNSLCIKSFPSRFIIENKTESNLQNAYEQLGKVYTEYLISDKSEGKRTSYYVVLLDDTIIGLFGKFECDSNLCIETSFDIIQKSEPKANIGCDLPYSVFSSNDELSSMNLSIVNNRRGLKFQDIEESFNYYLQGYFFQNYKNFVSDTMQSWSDENFSREFSSDESSIVNFLNLSILYYMTNPKKMEKWPQNIRNNMELLISNFTKNNQQLIDLQEEFVEKNRMCEVYLLHLLRFRISENGNEYREAQNGISSCGPMADWIYIRR